MFYLRDGLIDLIPYGICDLIVDPFREVFLLFFQNLPYGHIDIMGIGSGSLGQVQCKARITVDLIVGVQVGCTELHARHILQVEYRTIGIGLNNDVLELLRLAETPFVLNYRFKGLIRGLTELTRCDFKVLILDRIGDILRHQVIERQFLGIQPHPHCVVTRPQSGNLRHTIHPQ